jgi:hypothetical protein
LRGESEERHAGEEESEPGMGDDELAPLAPAIADVGGAMCVELGGEGHAAGVDART